MQLLLQTHLFTVVFRVFLYVTNNFHVVLCRPSHKILASPLVTHSSAGRLWLAALRRWIPFLTYQWLFLGLSLIQNTTFIPPPHHNCFTALFPGPPGSAGARRELLDFMVQGEINWGRNTDHPAGRHSTSTIPHIFYGPDALPAAQPTVSRHWRQNYIYYITLISQQNNSTRKMILKIHQLWTLLDTLQNKRMWYIPEGNTDSRWMSPVAVRSCY